MDRFVFVILHYCTIEHTIKCIQSIMEKCKNNNFEIVVVDNASPNNTGEKLNEKYKNENKVHVLLNKTNLGFSKGNNIGIKYAKKYLNPDFIIMCNNDTCLLQNDFCELIVKEYKNSNFAVMGPQILLPDNEICQIPSKDLPTKKFLRKETFSVRIQLFFDYIFMGDLLRKAKIKLRKILKKEQNDIKKLDINQKHVNVILHGCFLIFSKTYLENFEGLEEKTFLYREEELLYIQIRKKGLINIYNPEIKIFHSESSSIKLMTKTIRKKQIFFEKNYIKATKELYKKL